MECTFPIAEKTRIIQRPFKTLKAAEDFLWELYDEHQKAECLSAPTTSEEGTYSFKVSD